MAYSGFRPQSGYGIPFYREATGTSGGYQAGGRPPRPSLGETIANGVMGTVRHNTGATYTAGRQKGTTYDPDIGWYKTPGKEVPYESFAEWKKRGGSSLGRGPSQNRGRITRTEPGTRPGEMRTIDETPIDHRPPAMIPPMWQGIFDPFGGVTGNFYGQDISPPPPPMPEPANPAESFPTWGQFGSPVSSGDTGLFPPEISEDVENEISILDELIGSQGAPSWLR